MFVGKRSGAPGEGENVLGVNPYGHVKSLHAGQGRGATIYDEDVDVCWLLAYSDTHAVGERRDAYKHFEWLDSRDEFLPSEADYAALETVTAASLMDALRTRGSEMVEAARSQPGRELTDSFVMDDGQDASITISIEIVIESTGSAEQGWIAFVLPHDAPLDRGQLLDLIADLLPQHVDVDTVQVAADVNGRPVTYSEIAYTWEHYAGA
ncbi:hypothetical protein SAMN05880545_0984 [Microbacterium sp. RU33B]|nr:hypothetical protein SAMN05880545_0984 [Microbacterium sp. RU33B]